MRLVVDASVLVAEVLRARGRALLAHPRLDLVLAADTLSETEHELRQRVSLLVQLGHLEATLAERLLDEALATVAARVTLVPSEAYANHLEEAQRRIPRDPRDAPAVALAMVLGCGVWTADRDFFGCGLPISFGPPTRCCGTWRPRRARKAGALVQPRSYRRVACRASTASSAAAFARGNHDG